MARTSITEKMVSDFIKLYTIDKLSIGKISKKYDINPSTVRNHLIKNNITLRSISEAMTKVTPDMINNFINLYNNGKTTCDIGKIYNISVTTIVRYLTDNGVNLNVKKTDKYKDEVIYLYKEGMSQDKIQEKLGICKKQ